MDEPHHATPDLEARHSRIGSIELPRSPSVREGKIGLLAVPLVTRSRIWVIQLVVGGGLLIAALLHFMTNLDLMSGAGTASRLSINLTLVAIAPISCRVLLNFGVGHYAPS